MTREWLVVRCGRSPLPLFAVAPERSDHRTVRSTFSCDLRAGTRGFFRCLSAPPARIPTWSLLHGLLVSAWPLLAYTQGLALQPSMHGWTSQCMHTRELISWFQ